MKKQYFIVLLIVSYTTINAQLDISYGVKAGLDYSTNGDLNIIGGIGIPERPTSFENDGKLGFNLGFYAKINFPKIYIRSELLFSKFNTNFSFDPSDNGGSDYKNSLIELPVLLGYKLFKPFSIYIGPTLQYHLNNELDVSRGTIDLDIDKDVTFGISIGGMVEISKFGIDIRYTSNLSENKAANLEAIIFDNIGYIVDTKSNQFTINFSYKLH